MKGTIPFKKDILFKTKVAELEEIYINHEISDRSSGAISGNFTINGNYKMNIDSNYLEPFTYNVPFDIALDDRYDSKGIEIIIKDFKHQLIDNEILRVFIDVELDGLIEIEDLYQEEERLETEIEVAKEIEEELNIETEVELADTKTDVETTINIEPETEIEEDLTHEVNTIFNNLNHTEETYSTYNVYTLGNEESLETIINKYHTDLDTLARYNSLESIKPGSKLIFPINNQNE